MIRYHRNSWWSQVFVFRGGVFVRLLKPGLVYAAYCSLCYFIGEAEGLELGIGDTTESMRFFGGFVSFLLIFRLNQCYLRYDLAIRLTTTYFNVLISILDLSTSYLRAEAFDENLIRRGVERQVHSMDLCRAEMLKVNITRLVLALGASLTFHCRISENAITGGHLEPDTVPLVLFSYCRLRGLLLPWERALLHACWGLYHEDDLEESSDDEGETDNVFAKQSHSFSARLTYREQYHNGRKQSSVGVAVPVILLQLLRKQFKQGIGQRWGYYERVLNVMETKFMLVSQCFEEMDRLVTIPLPLAYLQHCKVLFILFVAIYPNTIPVSDGFWANVVSPCLLFCALFGFEILADQLENPLGDDDVDMNLFEMVHTLEVRAKVLFDVSFASESHMWEESFDLMLKHKRHLPDMKSICNMLEENERDELSSCCFEDHFSWLRFPPQVVEYLDVKERGVRKSGMRRRVVAWLKTIPCIHSSVDRIANFAGGRPSSFLPVPVSEAEEYEELKKRVGHADMISGSHFLCLQGRKGAMSKVLRDMHAQWAIAKDLSMEAEGLNHAKERIMSADHSALTKATSIRDRKKPPWRSLTRPLESMMPESPQASRVARRHPSLLRRQPSNLEAHFAYSDDSECDDPERIISRVSVRQAAGLEDSDSESQADVPDIEDTTQESRFVGLVKPLLNRSKKDVAFASESSSACEADADEKVAKAAVDLDKPQVDENTPKPGLRFSKEESESLEIPIEKELSNEDLPDSVSAPPLSTLEP